MAVGDDVYPGQDHVQGLGHGHGIEDAELLTGNPIHIEAPRDF